MVVVVFLSSMFLWVAAKLVYSHLVNRNMPRMYPTTAAHDPALTEVRRDSALIADLEELHLRAVHRLIIKLIQPRAYVVRNFTGRTLTF